MAGSRGRLDGIYAVSSAELTDLTQKGCLAFDVDFLLSFLSFVGLVAISAFHAGTVPLPSLAARPPIRPSRNPSLSRPLHKMVPGNGYRKNSALARLGRGRGPSSPALSVTNMGRSSLPLLIGTDPADPHYNPSFQSADNSLFSLLEIFLLAWELV